MDHTEQSKNWQHELREMIEQVPEERAPEVRAFLAGFLHGLDELQEKKAG